MRPLLAVPLLAAIALSSPSAAIQVMGKARIEDVWKPAKTPPGGTSWQLLAQTRLIDRTDPRDGVIYTKPAFPPAVKALAGKQVKVAGWMMPLENKTRQTHFVLLGYPPGCPFHFHAMPNQFVEVHAATPVPVDEAKMLVMTGTLQLTGQDESGIFYRLVNARPG